MATLKIEIDTDSSWSDLQRNIATAAKKIGFVTPISADTVLSDDQTTPLFAWFKKGLNEPTAEHDKKHKRKYEGLAAAIQECNNTPKKDLIVTCGGSISYDAAKVATNNIPFVSLLGVAPDSPPTLFKGGVLLDSIAANRDRLTLLTQPNSLPGGLQFLKSEVGLFCNKSSSMHQAEMDNWNMLVGKPQGNMSQIILGGNDGTGANSSSSYANDFTQATAKLLKALVVSADPFFGDTKTDLIVAANKWINDGTTLQPPQARYICYAGLGYANLSESPGNQPKKGSSTLFGPKLEDAYYLLGVVAGAALKIGAGDTLPLIRVANIRKDLT